MVRTSGAVSVYQIGRQGVADGLGKLGLRSLVSEGLSELLAWGNGGCFHGFGVSGVCSWLYGAGFIWMYFDDFGLLKMEVRQATK